MSPTKSKTHLQTLAASRGETMRSQRDKAYRQDRATDPRLRAADAVYRDKRWPKVRHIKVNEDPICEDCWKAAALTHEPSRSTTTSILRTRPNWRSTSTTS